MFSDLVSVLDECRTVLVALPDTCILSAACKASSCFAYILYLYIRRSRSRWVHAKGLNNTVMCLSSPIVTFTYRYVHV